MISELIFVTGVALFVTLLALAFRAGRKGKRVKHIILAITTIVTMIGLIWWVENLVHGQTYDQTVFRVHMGFVSFTLFTVLGLIALGTGMALRRSGGSARSFHRVFANFFVFSLLPTVGTGIWLYTTVGR